MLQYYDKLERVRALFYCCCFEVLVNWKLNITKESKGIKSLHKGSYSFWFLHFILQHSTESGKCKILRSILKMNEWWVITLVLYCLPNAFFCGIEKSISIFQKGLVVKLVWKVLIYIEFLKILNFWNLIHFSTLSSPRNAKTVNCKKKKKKRKWISYPA